MTNYVIEAQEELRRALAEIAPGEEIQPDLLPLYTLLVLQVVRGRVVVLGDVHDAWACERATSKPDHSDLVPFDQLSPEVARWDVPFHAAIYLAAARVRTQREVTR